MITNVKVVETKKVLALVIRKNVLLKDMPKEIGMCFDKLDKYIKSKNINKVDAPFVAYYNMDTNFMDIEIGFPIEKEVELIEDMIMSEVPEGKKIEYMFKGPYSQLAKAYDDMTTWLCENSLKMTGVVYEFYYNSPKEVFEYDLLTKVVFLLED